MREAFGHHSWATRQVLEACIALPADELETTVPAIYGSALETLRHLVDADNWYLRCISEGEFGIEGFEADDLPLADLVPVAESTAVAWQTLVARDLDPDAEIIVVRKDGRRTRATVGIRLAQVLHHGSDHRSQVCTALTTLGHAPAEFDVWAYGESLGTVTEDLAPST